MVVISVNCRFSQPTYDHMSILAPIRQCCLIRLSTLAKFIKLYKGPDRLSEIMRSSLNSDPLSPVLMEADLEALDRRVGTLLKTVSDCLAQARSWRDVVVDDLNIHSGDQHSVSRWQGCFVTRLWALAITKLLLLIIDNTSSIQYRQSARQSVGRTGWQMLKWYIKA